jgi:HEAT repeat protein
MEQIVAADFDRPAEQAVEELAAAGARALPHLYHLWSDWNRGYEDYAVTTAFQTFARIPSQLSLWVLVQGLVDDDDWSSEEAAEQLAGLPDLACPYLLYALTAPGGPAWSLALWGYDVLAKARCPRAFELLVQGLWYQGEEPHLAEGIQMSASLGLMDLGDERAIPVLHEWLRDPQADLGARDELVYGLTVSRDGHPWTEEIVGNLTPETLPGWG